MTNYHQLDDRKASFAAWPHPTRGWSVNPAKLARDGFYFAPSAEGTHSDQVKCYLCCASLAQWKARQDIHDRHFDANEHCPLFRLHHVDARRATFGREGERWWPHADDVVGSPDRLAIAGWYLRATAEDPDATKTVCGLASTGWQQGDDAFAEHEKHCKGACDMAEIKRQLEAYDAAQVTKSTNQTTEQVAEAEPAHEDVIMDESADAEPRGSTSMVDDRDEVDEEMLVTEQALALAQTVSEAMRDAAEAAGELVTESLIDQAIVAAAEEMQSRVEVRSTVSADELQMNIEKFLLKRVDQFSEDLRTILDGTIAQTSAAIPGL